MHAPYELADMAADVLVQIRARAPRVHCITNTVAQTYTANMLLAAGAVPSMTLSPEEIAAFVAGADALLVNLGTFDAERRAAIEVALQAAGAKGLPWVLDPVFIDRSADRAAFARELTTRRPTVVRLNQAEFEALRGGEVVDAQGFARSRQLVVALTGATDIVADGSRAVSIANGDPLMRLVTAMGCAGSALVATALAVGSDVLNATAAALTALGVAGEVAAANAGGPGSFGTAIIDALYHLDRPTLRARARVS